MSWAQVRQRRRSRTPATLGRSWLNNSAGQRRVKAGSAPFLDLKRGRDERIGTLPEGAERLLHDESIASGRPKARLALNR